MAVNVNYKAEKERIHEVIEYFKSQPKRVTAYDKQLVQKPIEKNTLYDDHLDFLFKLGIQIEIGDKKQNCDGKHSVKSGRVYFSRMLKNNMETRSNKLSDMCNLLKPVQTEEIF